jgi:hypothetical protein
MKSLCISLGFAVAGAMAFADTGDKRTSRSPLTDQIAQLVCYKIEEKSIASTFTEDAAQDCVALRKQGVPDKISFYRCPPIIVNDEGEIVGRQPGACENLY